MVHDMWLSLDDEIFRVTNQAKVVREQAHKLKLSFGVGEPISKSDLMVAVIKTLAACGHMLTLVGSHPGSSQTSPDKA